MLDILAQGERKFRADSPIRWAAHVKQVERHHCMKPAILLQFCRSELWRIDHPYAPDEYVHLDDIESVVRAVDMVLTEGQERYAGLGESFYEAFGAYLTAHRHRRAAFQHAVDQLALLFEGFLRTLVAGFLPDRDAQIVGDDGRSRGRLSVSGYVTDFVRELFKIDAHLWDKRPSYWTKQSVEVACYGLCFKHQQRAKHEARDYTLEKLEKLARHILSAYLFAARWLLAHSDIRGRIDRRIASISGNALFHWPAILNYQLSELRIGAEDEDLRKSAEELQALVEKLMVEAADIQSRGLDANAPDVKKLLSNAESAAYDYEMLVSESNAREWGREQQWSEYS